jgi:hypothetical protein
MRFRGSSVLLSLLVFAFSGVALYSAQSLFIATPINDLATRTYLGFEGGLYEHGANVVPTDDESSGKLYTSEIAPLDVNGNPDANQGHVILLSLGMSNALIEFNGFEKATESSSLANQATLAEWNGAQSGQDACYWFPAYGPPECNPTTENEYDRISKGLAQSNLSYLQVQAVWVDSANGRFHSENRGCLPLGTLCNSLCNPAAAGCLNTANKTNALNEEEEFAETLRAAKARFPNLKLAFFSARVFGGYAIGGQDEADPEPFAYETGFAVKWLIQAQINQMRTGTIDPVAGDLSFDVAPWITWGPYFWADGNIPRSDGLAWCFGQKGAPCRGEFDFSSGGIHLNATGSTKAGKLLLNYFTTSPYAVPWFNK